MSKSQCSFSLMENALILIQGVPDSVPGACYRSEKRGWMDKRVFSEWLSEPRAIRKYPGGLKRILYVDNANEYSKNPLTKPIAEKDQHRTRKFRTNATNLVQPADSFIFSKIKDAWRRRWDAYKVELICQGKWKNGEKSSGKLENPGKRFFPEACC